VGRAECANEKRYEEVMMAKKALAEEKGSLAAHPQAKREATRLIRTVVGHAQGIERMIEGERYCVDILKQVAAVQALLAKLADIVSESHMKHCVRLAIEESQGEQKIDELLEILKYLRSI
jgi:DNA-binding FrmR family transcriptional regulator